jgi:hypothetical protein
VSVWSKKNIHFHEQFGFKAISFDNSVQATNSVHESMRQTCGDELSMWPGLMLKRLIVGQTPL